MVVVFLLLFFFVIDNHMVTYEYGPGGRFCFPVSMNNYFVIIARITLL